MAASVFPRPNGRHHRVSPVSVLHAPGRARLVLAGELDETSCPQLTTAIATIPGDVPVEVDTREVTFMDSSVIAALAQLATEVSAPVLFVQPPALVRFLLDVTRIGDLVTIVEEDPGFPGPAS